MNCNMVITIYMVIIVITINCYHCYRFVEFKYGHLLSLVSYWCVLRRDSWGMIHNH